MIKISHEVPLKTLEESRNFNDYDYCLLHLALKYPSYKQFYIDSVQMGREVLLDNSLFELGDSLPLEKVAQGVIDIQPEWVVVPDCLNNAQKTMSRFKEWMSYYKDLKVKTIGVVQGASEEELIACYKFMSNYADKIAFPFASNSFNSPNSNLLQARSEGRQRLISKLVEEGIWNYNKPHHLLGCSLAKEFTYPLYQEVISSIDTSNPIVAAINHLRYGAEGLNTKPLVMLCDLSEYILSEEEHDLMLYNIQIFRKLCGREI